MPAKSQAQYRLMQAAAHNPDVAGKTGIPMSVAREYAEATKNPRKLPEKKHDPKKLAKALKSK